MAFRLHKRDGERHGFSNRHPYKTENDRYEGAQLQPPRYVVSMFVVVSSVVERSAVPIPRY
jgi:hypothetical protein